MAASSFISAVTRRLEGKVAVITGGASGIGKCTAKVFAHHGAKIVIADIQDELGHSVCDAIGQSNCSYVHCNVTDEDQIKNAVDKAVATYGKLDIMFNNAGILDTNKRSIVEKEKSDFEHVLSVNTTGVFLGIKHAARVMIPARTGTIISTCSVAATNLVAGLLGYCTSKNAVIGLTRTAAIELGEFGIRVNCLSPYGVATPLAKKFLGVNDEDFENIARSLANLKGVTLKAEDIANAALYLASEEGRYVSGHNLFVDGGASIFNPLKMMIRDH